MCPNLSSHQVQHPTNPAVLQPYHNYNVKPNNIYLFSVKMKVENQMLQGYVFYHRFF